MKANNTGMHLQFVRVDYVGLTAAGECSNVVTLHKRRKNTVTGPDCQPAVRAHGAVVQYRPQALAATASGFESTAPPASHPAIRSINFETE